jgi:hypothetical protein
MALMFSPVVWPEPAHCTAIAAGAVSVIPAVSGIVARPLFEETVPPLALPAASVRKRVLPYGVQEPGRLPAARHLPALTFWSNIASWC